MWWKWGFNSEITHILQTTTKDIKPIQDIISGK